MSKIGVWLDEQNAVIVKVFNDSERSPEILRLESNVDTKHGGGQGGGHSSRDDSHRLMERKNRELRGFFKEIVTQLDVAEQLALLGPGQTKRRFQHELEANYPRVAEKIIVTEPADQMPESQLVAHVRTVFRKPPPLRITPNRANQHERPTRLG